MNLARRLSFHYYTVFLVVGDDIGGKGGKEEQKDKENDERKNRKNI